MEHTDCFDSRALDIAARLARYDFEFLGSNLVSFFHKGAAFAFQYIVGFLGTELQFGWRFADC